MAEGVRGQPQGPRGPQALAPLANVWRAISPKFVPVMAVVTALLVTIVFMIITGGRGSVTRGLQIAGTAYSALLEGSLGVAVNDLASSDDMHLALTLATNQPITRADSGRLARRLGNMTAEQLDQARRLSATLAQVEALSDGEIEALGNRIPMINAVGADTLRAMEPLIAELAETDRGNVRDVAEGVAALSALDAGARAEVEALAPSAANMANQDLLTYMSIVAREGIVALERAAGQLAVLDELRIDATSAEAGNLTAIAEAGVANIRQTAEITELMDAAGIIDGVALANQLKLVDTLYGAGLLTNEDVAMALTTELDSAVENSLVIRRPRNQIVIDPGNRARAGIIFNNQNTPDDSSDDRPETVYLRLRGVALVFFPANLEEMIVRSIPFVIAGLAVGLGFKAGLFNIGAEGQLFAAGTMAVWVGFAPVFDGLPGLVRLPLAIIAGIVGGMVWGGIPGVLKAYTGAHEVINTIMMNFIALRLVDWLIKSTNPVILLDQTASTPRTPFISNRARLPVFDDISGAWFVLAAVAALLLMLWNRREQLQANPRVALRPLLFGVAVGVAGFFLSWIAVRGRLHLGLVLMIFAVWFTGWFLNRTTLGFELRTVGANADAARYAGMSVPRNIVMAMALSGALAGLAGAIEITGVEFKMQPEFFAGLGFDAIAVALLARNEPRNMIPAGFLWGALLASADLMQVRANIAIELVKIIQALIIMFVAADAIIRYLWRVPEATPEEKARAMRLSSWGG